MSDDIRIHLIVWFIRQPTGMTHLKISKYDLKRISTICFFERFNVKKVCKACSKNSHKIYPLSNLNSYLYNGESEIKANTNNSSEKFRMICCYISVWQKSMQYKTWQYISILLYYILFLQIITVSNKFT